MTEKYGYPLGDWNKAKDEMTAILAGRAKLRGMIPYSELIQKIEAISLEPHSYALAAMLGEVASAEDERGHGLLTVIVVHKDGDMQPLLWKRLNVIFAAPSFPEQLQDLFSDRLERFSWTWDEGWEALKYFGQDTLRRKEMTATDLFRGAGIVEALARHRKKKAKTVLALLDGQFGDEDCTLMNWLWPQFADLAVAMRLEEAVPLLMKHLGDETYAALSELARGALQRIGGDLVVREIDARWRDANNVAFRREAANILYHVRSDLCTEHCLDYFKVEEDDETKLNLAAALVAHFL